MSAKYTYKIEIPDARLEDIAPVLKAAENAQLEHGFQLKLEPVRERGPKGDGQSLRNMLDL